ncbi:MAG TPA: NADH-quinone oxidoreductase subunit N [Candidatus Hydrogenedentes bacterium]|nr:NADH-quinone oxidoreductase subunit N [Candidatus Hydrogenedentota bacterium]
MTIMDMVALVPLMLLALTATGVVLLMAFCRCHRTTVLVTLIGMGLSIVALALLPFVCVNRQVTPVLMIDTYAVLYMGILFVTSFVIAAMSYTYFEKQEGRKEEFYALLLMATLGAGVVAASCHFVSFFMGLETLSVSLYAMVAYTRKRQDSIEAAFKYLMVAAASAAFLLFGMALVYAESGSMEFTQIAKLRLDMPQGNLLVLLAGCGLMVVGIGFKLALVPFHLWTPDVYEGAPAPVTAYVATVSKGAMFALLMRYFAQVDMHQYPSLIFLFTLIAVVSMFFGNLLALLQNNIKRILAYSSIGNLGYVMVAFLASGKIAATAAAVFLASYFITTLGAMGIITALSGKDRDADSFEDYRGLFWKSPWLAAIFTAMLLSLAGIPLTAGFIGKFLLLEAGEESSVWISIAALVISSSIGLFYYLRIVLTMCDMSDKESAPAKPVSLTENLVLSCLFIALLFVGIFPAPLIHVAETLVASIL